MITNTPKTILVDGISAVAPMYRRNETETAEAQFYVVGNDKKRLGAFGYTVTDEIVPYMVKPIVLHSASVYDISGVTIPGDVTVFISSGFTKGSIEALKNNVIAATYADHNGNFNFSNIHSSNGMISMWICTVAQDAPTASLTYELSISDYNPEVGELLTYRFMEPEGNYKNPLFTISGSCSDDVEKVYLSCIESAESVIRLMETMCASCIPADDGSFIIKYSGDYDENYIIWGISKSNGTLVVDDIFIEEDASTCLSGDTLITMADGSQRRMDSVCVGDTVLSRNGAISRIHTVKHNRFSDYHTLYHFEDGTVIDETHPHRFYNVDQGFWQRLQLWNIGDHAVNQNGAEVALMSVERLDEKAEMFGIWTDDGTYYANGLLSGAAFCNKELLEEATAEQAVDMMLSADESWLLELMGLEGELPL